MHVWPHHFSRPSHKGHLHFHVVTSVVHISSHFTSSPWHGTTVTAPFRKALPSCDLSRVLLIAALPIYVVLSFPHTLGLFEVSSTHSKWSSGQWPHLCEWLYHHFLAEAWYCHHLIITLLPAAISSSTHSSRPRTWLILCSPVSSSSLFPSHSEFS